MPNSNALQLPPRIHLDPLPRDRLWKVLGATGRVLADSNRTMDIIVVEEIVAQAQLRHLLEAGVFEGSEGREVLRDRPLLADTELSELERLPAYSLGGAYARFVADNQLSSGLYDAPAAYTPDDERGYLMRRIRQCHDLWHVLTGLRVEGHDEILLHAFQLAQTGMPASVVLVVLGSLKHMLLEARWGALTWGLREAYARGRRATPLIGIYWERLWEVPLTEVRARYGIEPFTRVDRDRCAPWSLG